MYGTYFLALRSRRNNYSIPRLGKFFSLVIGNIPITCAYETPRCVQSREATTTFPLANLAEDTAQGNKRVLRAHILFRTCLGHWRLVSFYTVLALKNSSSNNCNRVTCSRPWALQKYLHRCLVLDQVADLNNMAEPPTKRRRLGNNDDNASGARDIEHATPPSLSHPISPPRKKKKREGTQLASPFRLTSIRDLSDAYNVGAVSLNDLVGDPLIAELWDFNYLHDLDFLMRQLDEDTRALTKVHVVHGFWKREDPNRLMLQEQAGQHKNVTLHTAYMPEMFGTHHSKMLVLLRHDDTAQVIIHTANMIAKDWANMTNGVWISPLLPKLQSPPSVTSTHGTIGSGSRFKFDLLSYLRAYNTVRNVCGSLVSDLAKHDFSAVRGALVASVPGKHDVDQEPEATRWGWQGLKDTLKRVPSQPGTSELVVQISSIATLGASDAWLQRTLFDSLSASRPPRQPSPISPRPDFKIVFPTPEEIRRSLDGYASGGSIHTKIQSAAQTKQLQYLRPLFHHWANDSAGGVPVVSASAGRRDSGRKRAAPHIKTYIRYGAKSIDWALLTSANISKQAWGEAVSKAGEVRIASWEIGVLVWPELLTGDAEATMVGTFKTDEPGREAEGGDENNSPVVGLRMPYDLPLQKYGDSEVPWVATMSHPEPDWMGQVWPGY
ncbi:tyrosyl-DNA phosphodiesterase [Ustulina deusta]|nr:tyrosyl-DNA phosphodiesterase [Ustulina deusta]